MITPLFADPGDTTIVQTFTFEEQNDPETNYDSPGRRWFNFPSGDTTYRKILMYYTLKCFEDGTAGGLGFPCGEWDYLTYNYLFDHTGVLDSNALTHPQFLANNLDFESLEYVSDPTFNAVQYMLTLNEVTDVISETTYEAELLDPLDDASILASENTGARTQFIYSVEELVALGMTAGNIQRLGLYLTNTDNIPDSWITIRYKLIADPELAAFDEENLNEIYSYTLNSATDGLNTFDLSNPISWDGTNHLLLDIAIEHAQGDAPAYVTTQATDLPVLNRMKWDNYGQYMEFSSSDEVKVPASVFESLETEVTVSFWVNGDPQLQPQNGTCFEGVDANNNRVLNSHLPWSNSRVYWDAGWDGGYDRIDKAANESDYEGKWNHWAFTKNTVTGEMHIYLNGDLWHSGTDKDNSLAGIVDFSIGAAAGWSNFYNGKIDEFRIWNKALDEATIAEWRHFHVTDAHPEYANLLAEYRFEGNNGEEVLDSSPNAAHALAQGSPVRKAHTATSLFMEPSADSDQRPHLRFYSGEYTTTAITDSYTTPVPVAPMSLTEFQVAGNDVEIVNVDFVYPTGYTYTFDADGAILDSTLIAQENTMLNNGLLEYFSAAFEVVDRYEIGRYITPYGINLDLEDGWTWVFDVTDYAPLLRDSVELEAGNWQELLDMKFIFIEGTPPRDIKRVEAFWKGTYNLNSFDDNVTEQTFDVEEGEEMFRLKTRASGHGFGTGNNCGEFCYNTHSVKVNGNTEWSWEIMQSCSDNPLYPQGGTWIYARAGWCPGMPVTTQDFELTPLITDETFSVDYDITYDPDGNYRFEGQLITYGAPNFALDAEVDDIIAPSDWKVKSRMNPMCNEPVIRIRNSGSETLTSLEIEFGFNGQMETFTWTGELGFLETEEVTLYAENAELWNGDTEAPQIFQVNLSSPNGQTDENPSNNTAQSHFYRPPVYTYGDEDDNRIIIWLKTNNAYWESSVAITDLDGNVVWDRDDYPEANTTYRDTIQLNAGCYKFHLMDSGLDGLSFFANSDGNGTCRLKKVGGASFIQFEPDFGKEIVHYFSFDTDLVSVEEQAQEQAQLSLCPNPATEQISVELHQVFQPVAYEIITTEGKVVSNGMINPVQHGRSVISLAGLPKGLYTFRVVSDEFPAWKRFVKM